MKPGAQVDIIQAGGGGLTGHGDVAQRLLQSDFQVNALRTNDVLRKDEWIQFDEALIDVARQRLPLVDMFVSDYPAMMTTIREAVKSQDGVTLQRTAHSLKGMLRNFQAEAGAQKALELEEMGQQGEFQDADQAYEVLSAELASLEKILHDLVEEVQR